MPGQKGNKGNTKSTSTAPRKGGKPDRRLAKNRSSAYDSGSRTKAHGSPTNAREKGSRNRVD